MLLARKDTCVGYRKNKIEMLQIKIKVISTNEKSIICQILLTMPDWTEMALLHTYPSSAIATKKKKKKKQQLPEHQIPKQQNEDSNINIIVSQIISVSP